MPRDDARSVSDVLQDILGNLQDIVRSEVRLAKIEFKTEASKAAQAGKPLMAGMALSIYALGMLLLALVYGLSLVLPPWMAALSIGVVLSLMAAILIGIGRARLRIVSPRAEKTARSMEENVQWLKDQTR
jgi:uncharacterized membrane protein YqjE